MQDHAGKLLQGPVEMSRTAGYMFYAPRDPFQTMLLEIKTNYANIAKLVLWNAESYMSCTLTTAFQFCPLYFSALCRKVQSRAEKYNQSYVCSVHSLLDLNRVVLCVSARAVCGGKHDDDSRVVDSHEQAQVLCLSVRL
jgi:hypothetical protein